jgi:hypothetical protein
MSFDKYVTFTFLAKILFLILSITHIYLKIKHKNTTDVKVMFWRERVEFLFITLMSFMLLYLFYPRANNEIYIDFETKLLLFIFGIILLTNAKWDIFIKESPIFTQIKQVI